MMVQPEKKKGFLAEFFKLVQSSFLTEFGRVKREDSLYRIYLLRQSRLLQLVSKEKLSHEQISKHLDKEPNEVDYSDLYALESYLISILPESELRLEVEANLRRLGDFGIEPATIDLMQKRMLEVTQTAHSQPSITVKSTTPVVNAGSTNSPSEQVHPRSNLPPNTPGVM
jgi:hypothetical protein